MDYQPIREKLFEHWELDEKGHGSYTFKPEYLTGRIIEADGKYFTVDEEGKRTYDPKYDLHESISDAEIAALLNAPGNYTNRREYAPRGAVVELGFFVDGQILAMDDGPAKAGWIAMLDRARGWMPAGDSDLTRASLLIMDRLVTDGIITEEQSWGPWTDTGLSWAESIYGKGFKITEQMVGEARNGN